MTPKAKKILKLVLEEIVLLGVLLLVFGLTFEGAIISIVLGLVVLMIGLKIIK